MIKGWIRAYSDENIKVKSSYSYSYRKKRSDFRNKFKTEFREDKNDTSKIIHKVPWGKEVVLPEGISNNKWSKVIYRRKSGYVQSSHLVEIAYVKRKDKGRKKFISTLTLKSGKKKELIWGDLVQILGRGRKTCEVRVRGVFGKMNSSDLSNIPLLEFYFIDVAQGDGVLVKTPTGRHLVIDGGLERISQQTGKNAADFLDWKYFMDYGHFRMELDGMIASHSDTDHFGGLHDLIRKNEMNERELDCNETKIKTFYHPGLSRWKNIKNANPSHKDGLGVNENGFFTQLLTDRKNAELASDGNSPNQLSGPWGRFIKALLKNDKRTKFSSLFVVKEELVNGSRLPEIWVSDKGYSIKVLAPIAKKNNGKLGLKDLGDTGKNSNGHSICLSIEYGAARILLTGDLNKKSMDWIMESFKDRMSNWSCDVAKACHHGSDDISYRFLEEINAAVTIISSGDAEGHAHPQPEIVGASALTGFVNIDRKKDKLITPLIYMTEIERSVTLGSINRIDIKNLPVSGQNISASVPARNIDEFKARDFLTPEQRKKFNRLKSKSEIRKFLSDVQSKERSYLESLENDMEKNKIKVDFNISMPQVPFGTRNENKRAWRSRIMEKNHYGLVNVRTDGETIMCATLNETGKKWIVHDFPARF